MLTSILNQAKENNQHNCN